MPKSRPNPRTRRRRQPAAPRGRADPAFAASHYNIVAGRPRRMLVSPMQTIQVCLNEIVGTFLTTSITVPTFNSAFFQLSAFSQATEYLSLFDQYRIDQIELYLEPRAAQGSTVFGELATCVDLDDASTPATVDSVAAHQGSLEGSGASGRYHKFVPHIAQAAYSGAFTSFANRGPTWIDSASSSVQHYGFKVGAGVFTAPVSYTLSVRALVSFRAPGI